MTDITDRLVFAVGNTIERQMDEGYHALTYTSVAEIAAAVLRELAQREEPWDRYELADIYDRLEGHA